MFLGLLFIMLAMSSFVFAVGSEISTNFVVDIPEKEVVNYVPTSSFVWNYLGYAVLAFAVLAFIYFGVNKKKVSKKSF
jgi:hypothetical protein